MTARRLWQWWSVAGLCAALCGLSVITATASPGECVGDCHGDGTVTVDEIVTMVGIALGGAPISACPAGDVNNDQHITVDEIIQAVNAALNGCIPGPTATPPPPSATPTATPTATVAVAVQFRTTLTGDQETPPVNTSAGGEAVVVLSADAMSLTYRLTVTGLTREQILFAHIHAGAPGVPGPVVFTLSAGPFDSPLEGTLTVADFVPNAAGVATFGDFLAKLQAGQTYVNVHTVAHAGGEIRGQLTLAPQVEFHAALSGDQETPPVNTGAGGDAVVTLNPEETVLSYVLTVTGLTGEQILFAYIHVGAPGVAGPAVFMLSGGPFDSPLQGTLTNADFVPNAAAGVPTFADFVDTLRAGNTYVDVSTTAHAGGEIRGQLATEFIAQATDFQCLTDWTKVRDFRVTNRLGHLEEALSVADASANTAGLEYPVGTILQLLPSEALVKRGGNFDPPNHNWEYFSLRIDPTGTAILSRGRDNVINSSGGNCFSCHSAARDFDFVCETNHGCIPLGLPESLIDFFQQSDERCPTPSPGA
jgi:hypothetical protein